MFREMRQQGQDSVRSDSSVIVFLKAVALAVGFTVGVFAVCALLLTYTGLPLAAIPFIVLLTTIASVVLAGMQASKSAENKGYLKGAVTGVLYVLLIYVISLLISGEFIFSAYTLVLLAIGLFGGAIGGILGINLSVKQRRRYRETH